MFERSTIKPEHPIYELIEERLEKGLFFKLMNNSVFPPDDGKHQKASEYTLGQLRK